MIKKEFQILLTAVMFYTRIPCPKWVGHQLEFINASTRYLPIIGWVVGIIQTIFLFVGLFFFPPIISVMLALVISILLTGAFHEDGFVDVCDGFGGGWSKEKILLIMKDSRIGTYGAIGIIFLLGIKIFTIVNLLQLFPDQIAFGFLIISAHSLSRATAVLLIYLQPYVRDDQQSKAKPIALGISTINLSLTLLFAVLPFIGFLYWVQYSYVMAIIPLLAMTSYLMYYFKKWIGGYTGDCLGATQQLNEILFLLTISALCKFM